MNGERRPEAPLSQPPGSVAGAEVGHVDHFTAVPRRFTDAHIADELDAAHVVIGVHVAARCYEVRNTAGGVAALRLSALAELCGVSDETVRRKLHELRERRWIDFTPPGSGQRAAWRVWLTGLARDRESSRAPQQLHSSSTKDPPPVWSSSSTGLPGSGTGIPLGNTESTSTPAPQDEVPVPDRRNETRRDETFLTEENYDHVVGKTTAKTPELERAFLADCQALVDEGQARWVENEARSGSL
jgi:hypothetical protein